jgi:hypothetical protein
MSGKLRVPAAISLEEKPQYPLNKWLGAPGVRVNISERRNITCPYRESNP